MIYKFYQTLWRLFDSLNQIEISSLIQRELANPTSDNCDSRSIRIALHSSAKPAEIKFHKTNLIRLSVTSIRNDSTAVIVIDGRLVPSRQTSIYQWKEVVLPTRRRRGTLLSLLPARKLLGERVVSVLFWEENGDKFAFRTQRSEPLFATTRWLYRTDDCKAVWSCCRGRAAAAETTGEVSRFTIAILCTTVV